MGPLLMELDPFEKVRIEAAGTVLQTVADPVSYDREEVVYPSDFLINAEKGTIQWLANKGHEYEPLRANYGRYMLFGACGNLQTSPEGEQYCAIYDSRPKVCKDFEVNGPTCRVMRATRVDISPRRKA